MYTITVNIAKIGSSKSDSSRSVVGLAWLTATDASGQKHDLGYQPDKGVVTNDSRLYINPEYQRTAVISEAQFKI